MIWVPKFISNLRDALISSPANNEVLTYETASGKWKNKAASGGGKVAQVVNYSTGTMVDGSVLIPQDNTIPQNTEGFEYMTLAITPTNASSKLIIEVHFNYAVDAFVDMVMALFQDSTADALAVAENSHSNMQFATLRHYMTAGTTGTTTFKLRAGKASTTGRIRMNGNNSPGALYNGKLISSITITEVLP